MVDGNVMRHRGAHDLRETGPLSDSSSPRREVVALYHEY